MRGWFRQAAFVAIASVSLLSAASAVDTKTHRFTKPHRLVIAAFPGKVQFSACSNTRESMEKKEGHPITVLSDAVVVPSGVVRLKELQEKGWSYLRPQTQQEL
jgi:intracellular sulfur oxidation DsrE/DsrF family protein